MLRSSVWRSADGGRKPVTRGRLLSTPFIRKALGKRKEGRQEERLAPAVLAPAVLPQGKKENLLWGDSVKLDKN